jgi:hypothetical protein
MHDRPWVSDRERNQVPGQVPRPWYGARDIGGRRVSHDEDEVYPDCEPEALLP